MQLSIGGTVFGLLLKADASPIWPLLARLYISYFRGGDRSSQSTVSMIFATARLASNCFHSVSNRQSFNTVVMPPKPLRAAILLLIKVSAASMTANSRAFGHCGAAAAVESLIRNRVKCTRRSGRPGRKPTVKRRLITRRTLEVFTIVEPRLGPSSLGSWRQYYCRRRCRSSF